MILSGLRISLQSRRRDTRALSARLYGIYSYALSGVPRPNAGRGVIVFVLQYGTERDRLLTAP
ncbi:hypothetical protein SPHINGOAX6_70875 [Sphingomonas sp. AX6]|nr:hypothetical protein SPHINGOAX6_70875 [Sphingomonas sp. AX6]